MTGRALVLRYGLFAILSTVVNLATQRVSLWAYDGAGGLFAAILAGTAAGLVLKYLLDKYFIFFDRNGGLATHGRQFALYTAMGLVTTAIFWATEYVFWLVWGTQLMREVGAVLGLAVGYIAKYQLDRRFVFVPTDSAEQVPA